MKLEPYVRLFLEVEELFGAEPEGYALGIRGYEFDAFGETLSAGARENLTAALRFLLPVLEKRNFSEVAADDGNDSVTAAFYGEAKCKTEST